jgi:flagellar export protein FliJ
VAQQVRSGDGDAVLRGSRCLAYINRQLAGAHVLVERQLREVEARRIELLFAAQEREALTRLCERRREEYEGQIARREQRELEEAGTAGYVAARTAQAAAASTAGIRD